MSNPLVAKYGEARLPRYTSYPTAPAFSSAIGPDAYAQALANLDQDRPVSLYLHVPFCRSMCWYCGCHTSITRQDRPILEYLDVLHQEIELVAFAAHKPIMVENVHFGGGTPTIVRPDDFRALIKKLRSAFDFQSDCSIAIEIDPRTLSAEMVEALGENGVDRASLGVQSFDPMVQAAINRKQSVEQTSAAVSLLRASGVSSINFDLIYGLPHQTVQSCIDTVNASIEMRPERFAVFGYAHIPAFKKHQRLIDDATLPCADERNTQAEAIASQLVAAGYVQIGLDHFALPNDTLSVASSLGEVRRNFQGYTTDTCETLIGIGASAIGKLPMGYVQNEVALGTYVDRVASGVLATAKGYRLTDEDRLRARIIERLMCDFSVDLNSITESSGFDVDYLLVNNGRLKDLEGDGVIEIDDGKVTVRQESRFMIRAVAAAFDAYLGISGRTHSKAA
ncbi:oxygen-independent coproporphyrinogen III oxidase [Rhizobium calliandrae]|uniref:Coproporphyrinogen-III oxidase n=1 Tax=Rhizobium calliandrae TaxID=1312182 RepID=A0ABT7KBC2_9HYPH|nr:oxygen-independent coproporphyrinogen III oxidase [Rhizobium calliandrae]MDL2405906.1 oxygen-independent coproporphyrinogen III oxidase [Rhizobium calliandrae]